MGANMGLKRAGMILVCALFLILTLPARAEEEALEAPELTYRCTVTFLGTKQERAFALTDGKINTSCRMKEKDELILEAPEDMGALILRFYQQGDDFLLIEEDEQGGRLQERTLTAAAALPVFLGPGCRRVRIEAPAQGLRICELMESRKLYLNSELKLTDVAAMLGTNRNTISTCINTQRGCSFSQLLSVYRIDYAKELMRRQPDIKIAEVWTQSGFTNETSFFRTFKAFTGLTPNEWKASSGE